MKTVKIYFLVLLLISVSAGLRSQYLAPVAGEPVLSGHDSFTINSDCEAAFTVVLDSLSTSPYLYHFKDISTGNMVSWHWDFGDGKFSLEQNPSHQYDEPGTFQVCLTVADQLFNPTCTDETCEEITTLEYFSLGGLVYAGEYPLNNPVVNGDTGVASLYRIVDNQVVFVENQYFLDYGYYWFGYLIPGEYLVKISLTEGSPNFKNYFTTYYGDAISWIKAELLNISSGSFYEEEIYLVPVQDLSAGQGIIRGYVNFEQEPVYSMPPMAQTTVILADKDHLPLQFTHPNPAGYFEFTGIPYDSYFISADATGKAASTVNVTLSESVPLVEGINLTIFGGNPSSVPEGFENGIKVTRVYPNPAKEKIHIGLYTSISAPIGVKVVDISGKTHFSTYGRFEKGFNEIIVPTGSLPAGLYVIILQPQGNYQPVTAKFVR